MLKEALNYIVKLAAPHTFNTPSGDFYYDFGDGNAPRLLEAAPIRDGSLRQLKSLDALIQTVKKEYGVCAESRLVIDDRTTLYVSVVSPTLVEVYTNPVRVSNEYHRQMVFEVEASDVPGFRSTTFGYEEAMVALRSRFQPTEGQEYLLSLMSRITTENSVTTEDDGITQRATVRQGIGMVGVEPVRPIVSLRPYRTFQEVAQPESEFLFRLDKDRNVSLTEADGGMWRLAARQTVKDYLTDAFAEEIEAGTVVVML